MSLAATRSLDPWRWLGFPIAQCLGWTVLFSIPLKIFTLQLPEPVFPMVAAFSWAVIRPSVLAPFGVLVLGLFLDYFWGGPTGLWALSLLVTYGAVLATRNMMVGQSRPMMWAWYCAATAVALGAGTLFSMLDAKATPSLIAVAWQFLATILLYPFAHRLIDRFEDADVRFR